VGRKIQSGAKARTESERGEGEIATRRRKQNPGGGCKKINRSHTHTHRQRTTPPTTTHTHAHDENNIPNEHLPQTLNNARRCRDDGVNVKTRATSRLYLRSNSLPISAVEIGHASLAPALALAAVDHAVNGKGL